MIARFLTSTALTIAVAISNPALADDKPFRLDEALKTPDWLTISGSQRTRYESLDGQFRAGGNGGDQLLTLRTTLLVEAKFDAIRIGAEVFDVRTYLGDSGTAIGTGTTNPLEPVQAYIGVDLGDAFGEGSRTELLGGRFTLDLGSRRLVGRNNFRTTTNAFTGVRADWKSAGGDQLVAFYTLPQRRQPTARAALLDNDVEFDDESFAQQFWGVHYTRKKLFSDLSGELFVFGLYERDDGAFQTRNRDIVTPGARIFSSPKAGQFDVEFEGGYQFGDARSSSNAANTTDLDVKAYYVHAETGYTFDTAWAPRLAFEYDFATGDKDPTDGEYNRFDSLFGPRRPDFGPTGIYGPLERANINSPGVRLELKPSKRLDGFAFYRAVWLDEANDAFGQTRVVDQAGASGKFAAHQIEGRVRYWLVPKNVRLDIGGAYLINGGFLENAPNATGEGDTAYFYSDIEFAF